MHGASRSCYTHARIHYVQKWIWLTRICSNYGHECMGQADRAIHKRPYNPIRGEQMEGYKTILPHWKHKCVTNVNG